MYLSTESLLVILLVGLVAGWLAAHIVDGAGLGLVGDMAIGIVGAFIGDWLLPRLGLYLGVGTIGAIINATIGATLLLLIIRLARGRRRRWGWGSRW
jgi:uncharacterized membrane protein YeaQ/YmgE (transglycosylase-associated protein family)